MRSFSPFLWIGTTFAFFHRLGKVFLRLELLNMIESGFTILLSHSFNILMDTSSCTRALLVSSVLIILYISSSWILKGDSLVSIIYIWFSGNLLSFGKGLLWDEKYLLKILAFPLKPVIIFPFAEKGGIIGFFYTIVRWFNYRPICLGAGF